MGQDEDMLSPLVLIVVSLGVISLLLYFVSWFEQRLLSPQAVIVHAARSRQAPAEHVEKLVAFESQRLLQGLSSSPADRAEREAAAAS